MGRLIRFELKKMLSGKFFWIALCLLLAVNILLSCGAWELYNLFMDADENVLSTAEEGFSFFDYFTSSLSASIISTGPWISPMTTTAKQNTVPT